MTKRKIIYSLFVLLAVGYRLLAQSCSSSPVTALASNMEISAGQTSTLYNTGCIDGKISWATSTNQAVTNLTVSPTATTSYRVTCTYSATATCSSTVQITVLPACSLNVSATKASIIAGEVTSLSSSGCIFPAKVTWRDNDGNLVDPNAFQSPKKTTTYVAMCALANGKTCTAFTTVTVSPVCSIDANSFHSIIDQGESTTLTHTGCNTGTVTWTQGNTTLTNLSVTPTSTSTYRATCSYGTGNTCFDEVTVNVNPACSINASVQPATINSGQSSTLSATGCVCGVITWKDQLGNTINSTTVSPTSTSSYRATCSYPVTGASCNTDVTVVVNTPCSLSASVSQANIVVGQKTVLYSNGCAGGQISWKNNSNNSTISDLQVNPTVTTSYTATCSYGGTNTCTSSVTVNVSTNCGLTAGATSLAVVSGTITNLNVQGCSSTATATWRQGSTILTSLAVNPTSTTNYTVTCSNNTTCTGNVTILVVPSCSISATAANTNLISGQRTTLLATGCTNGIVTWTQSGTALTSPLVNPTVNTSYTATCSYPGINNTCTSTVTINVLPACSLNASATNTVLTSGSSTTLTHSGCTGGTVSWINVSNNSTINAPFTVSPTNTTTYRAKCTYNNHAASSCESAVVVTVVPACSIAANPVSNSITAGQSITLGHTGCATGVVTWKDNQNNAIANNALTIKPAATTTYTVTCSNGGINSCSSSVTVNVSYAVSLGTITATRPSCGINNNASLTIPLNRPVTGNEKQFRLTLQKTGTASETYFTVNDKFETIKNLSAGQYSLLVESLNGNTVLATANSTYTIQASDQIGLSSTATDVKCFGGTDGEIKLLASGGQSPYYYEINNSLTYKAFDTGTNLLLKSQKQGTYVFTVKDRNGCVSDTKSVVVAQPTAALAATVSGLVNPRGFETKDGQASVTVTGGTPDYLFEWADSLGTSYGKGTSTITAANTINKNNSLRGGTYTIKIFDKNYATATDKAGCTISKTFKLIEPPQLKIAFIVDKAASCADRADGKFSLKLSGGVPFDSGDPYKLVVKHKTIAYNENNVLVHDYVPPGVYLMTITDKNDVSRTLEYTLPSPAALVAKASKIVNLNCFNQNIGSIELSVSGGKGPYRADWNNELKGLKINNLAAGKYTAVVYDSLNCDAIVLAEITQPKKLEAILDVVKPICADSCSGQVKANLLGGTLPYKYTWADTTKTSLSISNICHNTSQTITVTDKNGCTAQASNTMPGLLKINIPISGERSLCANSKIWLNAFTSRAKKYTWTVPKNGSSNEPHVISSEPGLYKVTVRDSSNCVFTSSVTVKASTSTSPKYLFTAPSQAVVNDPIKLVNLVNPLPSKVEWILPSNANIKNTTNIQAQLSFAQKGEYTLGMQATLADCEVYTSTKIQIIEGESQLTNNLLNNTSLVLGPNPSTSNLRLQVQFDEVTAFRVSIVAVDDPTTVIFNNNYIEATQSDINIDLSRQKSGNYLLILESKKEKITKKIAIIR